MKYRVFSEKQWLQVLDNNGYRLLKNNGSHKIYKNDKTGDTILFPKSLNPMLIRRTIKEHGLVVV